jgi:hypothetical protein
LLVEVRRRRPRGEEGQGCRGTTRRYLSRGKNIPGKIRPGDVASYRCLGRAEPDGLRGSLKSAICGAISHGAQRKGEPHGHAVRAMKQARGAKNGAPDNRTRARRKESLNKEVQVLRTGVSRTFVGRAEAKDVRRRGRNEEEREAGDRLSDGGEGGGRALGRPQARPFPTIGYHAARAALGLGGTAGGRRMAVVCVRSTLPSVSTITAG